MKNTGGGNSLRFYAKTRILTEMIGLARKRALYDKDYLILVMDASALKVFSSCCKMFDVYGAGLYHIERLETKRKKFPKTDAIYFVSPTKHSIQKILDDFVTKDDGTKKKDEGLLAGTLATPLLNKAPTKKA